MKYLRFLVLVFISASCFAQNINVEFKRGIEIGIEKERSTSGNETSARGGLGDRPSERPGGRLPAMSKPQVTAGKWPQFNQLNDGKQISAVSHRYINRVSTLIRGIKGLQALLVGSSLSSLYSDNPRDFIGNNIISVFGVAQNDMLNLAESINNLETIKVNNLYDIAASAMMDLDDLVKDPNIATNTEARTIIAREYGFWNSLANNIYKVKNKPKKNSVAELPDFDSF